MAVTSQRLLVIFILLNMSIGALMTAEQSQSADIFGYFEKDYNSSMVDSSNMRTEDNLYGNARSSGTTYDNPPAFSAIKTGLGIIKYIWNSINPLSISPYTYSDEDIITKFIASIVMVVRIILFALASMEIYFIWVNKKQS